MPLVGLFEGGFLQQFILSRLPPEVTDPILGVCCATQWTPLLDDDVSKRFVDSFQKKQGHVPDQSEAAPYTCVQIALAALKATGGDTTPEKLRQALLGADVRTPQGRVRFDQKTRFVIMDVIVGKLDKKDGVFVVSPLQIYRDVPPEGL